MGAKAVTSLVDTLMRLHSFGRLRVLSVRQTVDKRICLPMGVHNIANNDHMLGLDPLAGTHLKVMEPTNLKDSVSVF